MSGGGPPVTPDGRYLVVRGRLWRRSDPSLAQEERAALVDALMRARRAVGSALRTGDSTALAEARGAVDRAKLALGERGPVWWRDGAPDLNRRMVANTCYAGWFETLGRGGPHDREDHEDGLARKGDPMTEAGNCRS